MAELTDILASGDIPAIDAGEINENGVSLLALILIIQAQLADGITLPEIDGATANENSMFFNTDTGLVSWKSHGGTILRFNLSL